MIMASTLSKEVLEKYKNDIFVETGTYLGGGIEVALECGFKKIYSMEIDPEKVKYNTERFKKEIDDGIVEIIEGDTFDVFCDVLSKINEPATFWLDAHWDGSVLGVYRCPLPFELHSLLSHPIREHTILIDDRRLFGHGDWGQGIDERSLVNQLFKINQNYTIGVEDGYIPNDILVAKLS